MFDRTVKINCSEVNFYECLFSFYGFHEQLFMVDPSILQFVGWVLGENEVATLNIQDQPQASGVLFWV